VTVAPTSTGWSVSVSDPGGALLAPFVVSAVDWYGDTATYVARSGVSTEVAVGGGGFVAPDERDVHPYPPFDEQGLAEALLPSRLGGRSTDAFLARSAAHQERALENAFPGMTPDGLAPFVARLDSDVARASALQNACFLHGGVGEPAWDDALVRALQDPPITRYRPSLEYCGPTVGAAFTEELVALEARRRLSDHARLEYLVSFAHDARGMAAIGRLEADPPTRELGLIAADRLAIIVVFSGALDSPQAEEGKAARRAGTR